MAKKRVSLVHAPEDQKDFNDQEKQKAATFGKPGKREFKGTQKLGSYRIGEETIERVNQTAKKYNVNKADLVRFLLERGIDLLEAGELEIVYSEDRKPRNIEF